jgi:3-hydroxyacyl-[acyl-carrier-protein] dehydratase
MTREEIKDILPHREPMLLVDEAHKNEDGTVTGSYTVRGDEFFLQGHFPDNPIVPGVMLCEMASQCSSLLMAEKVKGKLTLFAGMNNVKFKVPVYVGDTVKFTCTFVRAIGPFHFMKAEGYNGDKLSMSGEFSFALVDPSKMR